MVKWLRAQLWWFSQRDSPSMAILAGGKEAPAPVIGPSLRHGEVGCPSSTEELSHAMPPLWPFFLLQINQYGTQKSPAVSSHFTDQVTGAACSSPTSLPITFLGVLLPTLDQAIRPKSQEVPFMRQEIE